MNTYIAASEVQKDTDLCDQWAVTQQMKCSVDKRTVIEMRLQNNQTKYKKNKPVQKYLITALEVPF